MTERFYAGGFLFHPKTRSVFLHLRDDKTPIHPNQWAFFGGLNEGTESPKECFIREFKEETGIDVTIDQVHRVCDYLNENRGTWRHVFYVESMIGKYEVTLTEGQGCDWIPLERVFDYDLTEKTRQDLQLFVKSRK
jgi:8-oxo-dGTP diphosphatase